MDIDFADDTRNRVIEYVRERYGEKCCQSNCYVRSIESERGNQRAGRVLGINLSEVER